MANYYVGFHARGIQELKQIIEIPGVNLVELKPDSFARKGTPIYNYRNGEFALNERLISELASMCQGRRVQIHLPYEESHDASIESGLCQADPNHHPILLRRYEMVAYLFEKIWHRFNCDNASSWIQI